MSSRNLFNKEGTPIQWGHSGKQKYLPLSSTEENELVSLYFEQLKKFPPLKAEESHALALQAQQGDENSRQRLIQHHLRLVVKIAKAFRSRGLSMADLIEEGNLGLIHAVKKFDPHQGCRFTTYAVWWIRQAIAKAVMEQSNTIRLPTHVLKMVNQLLKKNIELTQALQHTPSQRELSKGLSFSPTDLHQLQQAIQSTHIVPLSDAQDDYASSSVLTSQEPDCFELVATQDLHRFIMLFLKELPAQEREVIARRFGLLNFEMQTLHSISQELSLSKERIRQIQLSALKRLRAILTERGVCIGSFELH
jgi:RNA polymerase nonessential primary-like sigma factor